MQAANPDFFQSGNPVDTDRKSQSDNGIVLVLAV
jgi:hypothetical protein